MIRILKNIINEGYYYELQMKKVLMFQDVLFTSTSQIPLSHQVIMEGKKPIETAAVRKDEVLDSLDSVKSDCVYHLALNK